MITRVSDIVHMCGNSLLVNTAHLSRFKAIVIGNEENGLYKLKGHSEAAMTHAIENSCEFWHKRLAPHQLQGATIHMQSCHRFTRTQG